MAHHDEHKPIIDLDRPAVEVTDLVKTYRRGGVPAVAGISFTTGRGEIFGLLGPNGSGKTTTVRILVTLLRQTAGTALVGGFDTWREPQQVRRLIGYAGQFTGVDDDLTVAENLAYAAMLQRVPHNESWRRAGTLTRKSDITGAGGSTRRSAAEPGSRHVPG